MGTICGVYNGTCSISLKRKNTKEERETKRDTVNCRRTEIEREIKNVTKERSKAPSIEMMNPLQQMKNRDRQRDKFQGSHHRHAIGTVTGGKANPWKQSKPD
ncbi:hypothetical protein SO802_006183 [Lithocarpus litseifolius]|uniref:Uncharacterized protein n=1 Tax=Lithocarpus litseifolius TaxID=425828 RepID=A0AAW2DP50_9ROSI